MQVSTVFACVSKLGGAISQVPINEYREKDDGTREQTKKTDLWYLLNESPSPTWTAASWWEWVVKCIVLRGDQHTEIVRSKRPSTYGDVIGFKVHHPSCSVARRYGDRLVYDVYDVYTERFYTVDQDDMLHFVGLGFDGVSSLSMIQYGARNGVGNSLAAADYTGRSIGEGAMPQISLKFPNKLDKDQKDGLRESFVKTYGTNASVNGVSARRLPLVLTEGGEAQVLSITPVDMELLGSRQFEREDICHAIGVPPVLIGDSSKTSSWGTGIEQITLGFVKYTCRPHMVRWKQELNRKLFRRAGPFLDHDLDALLAGDSEAQSKSWRAALGGPGSGTGFMTPNEIRKQKNLPPIEGGEKLFIATPRKNAGDGKKEGDEP